MVGVLGTTARRRPDVAGRARGTADVGPRLRPRYQAGTSGVPTRGRDVCRVQSREPAARMMIDTPRAIPADRRAGHALHERAIWAGAWVVLRRSAGGARAEIGE